VSISVTKLLDLILIVAAVVVIFGFLSSVFFAFTEEAWACRISVSIASWKLSDTLNCRVSYIDMPARIHKQEEGGVFIAEQMLECHSVFQADRKEPLKTQEWLNKGPAIVARTLLGLDPGGKAFDLDFDTAAGDIVDALTGNPTARYQYCNVCAIITLPPDAEIEDFRDLLVTHHFKGAPFSDHLYPGDDKTRFDHYYPKNSDAFLKATDEPARAIILYSEGKLRSGEEVVGITAMNLTDFHKTLYDVNNRDDALCMRYLS
jgi:hypothetical protein